MKDVGLIRLYLLRAMYALIAVGLAVTVIPGAVSTSGTSTDSYTVIDSILLGFCLMALVGIRYPLKMLPVLLLELIWKAIWLLLFALPMYLYHSLDEYAIELIFACGMGVVLTPLVIPWGYVFQHYVVAQGNEWR